MERKLDQIRDALGLSDATLERHAGRNLDAALIDIDHADGHCDKICRRTIKRVIDQLATVERILREG